MKTRSTHRCRHISVMNFACAILLLFAIADYCSSHLLHRTIGTMTDDQPPDELIPYRRTLPYRDVVRQYREPIYERPLENRISTQVYQKKAQTKRLKASEIVEILREMSDKKGVARDGRLKAVRFGISRKRGSTKGYFR